MLEKNSIDYSIESQKKFFDSGKTRDGSFILSQLKILKKAIEENEKEILLSLKKDLGKSEFEAYETEVGIVLYELNHAIKNIEKWRRPKKVKNPIANFGSKSYIYSQPYGCCLIITPWNYPFQLAISPLIGSISAGNCSVIKMSEYSPYTSETIKNILNNYFSMDYIYVVDGDLDTSKYILDSDFDYIFFTGSPNVGKIVAQKAASKLIPVTLELGGKSPCILDSSANMDKAIKKIVWGKLINCGQTCVAPDYLIIERGLKDTFVEKFKFYVEAFYTETPIISNDYTKIITERHYDRLLSLIDGSKVVFGGGAERESLKIEPTLIDEVNVNDIIMNEEIFGPLLPILEYDNFSDIKSIVSNNKNPLALYVFSEDSTFINRIIDEISFGGGCVNDTIMHITNYNLPFGGIRGSGIGSYHGKKSFDTFSHKKSIMKSSSIIDMNFKYPPYSLKSYKLIKKIFTKF